MELREFQEKTNQELGAELLQVRKELASANAKNIELQERLNEYYDKNVSLWRDNNELWQKLQDAEGSDGEYPDPNNAFHLTGKDLDDAINKRKQY